MTTPLPAHGDATRGTAPADLRGVGGPGSIHRVAPPASTAVDTTAPGTRLDLLGAELDGTASMVPARLAEFAAARRCAHLALERLGGSPREVGRGDRGQPVWPAGVVGSLTHCAGYAAAVVADSRVFVSLGIDAEPHEPLPAKVWERICGPDEIDHGADLSVASAGTAWDRIQFCAKEAVFKTLSRTEQRWFRFTDVRVRLGLDGTVGIVPGAPRERLRLWTRGERPHGWWALDDSRIVVCVVVEHG